VQMRSFYKFQFDVSVTARNIIIFSLTLVLFVASMGATCMVNGPLCGVAAVCLMLST